MADAKRFSPAITAKKAISSANASTVYSIGTVWKAYNLVDKVEGDSPSNVSKVATAFDTATDATSVTAATASTNGTKYVSLAKGKIQASTTATTGNGKGLVVSFKTDANGKNSTTTSDYEIVWGGTGYAAGNKVTIDGFPGSELTVAIS